MKPAAERILEGKYAINFGVYTQDELQAIARRALVDIWPVAKIEIAFEAMQEALEKLKKEYGYQ